MLWTLVVPTVDTQINHEIVDHDLDLEIDHDLNIVVPLLECNYRPALDSRDRHNLVAEPILQEDWLQMDIQDYCKNLRILTVQCLISPIFCPLTFFRETKCARNILSCIVIVS
jgi:hypothetical protein